MTDDDPLEHADVGQTESIEEDVTIWQRRHEPNVFEGRDRVGDAEITDVEFVEDEYGERCLKLTYRGEVTKTLAPNWDHCEEPRNAAEAKQQRRATWAQKLATGIGIAFGLFVIPAISVVFVNDALSKITINGESAGGVSWFGYGLLVTLVLLLLAVRRWVASHSASKGVVA